MFSVLAGAIGSHQLSLNELNESTSRKLIRYSPQLEENLRIAEMRKWKEAIKRSMGWTQLDYCT